MNNPTTSGVDEKDYSITSVVADNRMNTVTSFADIVRGNQSLKSVLRVNPVIPAQNKPVIQKKQVVQFTLV